MTTHLDESAQEPRTSPPTDRSIPIALFGLTLCLCLFRITHKSFWVDEGASLVMSESWSSIHSAIFETGGNSFLYYVVLHLWRKVGEWDAWLRALSALAAAGAVPVLFFIGREFVHRNAALLGALFLAFSPFFIAYGQELRGYSFGLFFICLATLYLIRAVRRDAVTDWVGFVVSALLALFSHYYVLLVLLAHAFTLVVFFAKEVRWARALAAAAAIGIVFFGFFAWAVLGATQAQLSYLEAPTIEAVVGLVKRFGGDYINGTSRLAFVVYVAVAAVLAPLFVNFRGRSAAIGNVVGLVCWFGIPIALAFVLSLLWRPVFDYRYLIFCLPALALLVSAAADRLRSQIAVLVFATAVLVMPIAGLVNWYRALPNADFRAAAAYIAKDVHGSEPLLLYAYFIRQPLLHYLSEPQGAPPAIPTIWQGNWLPHITSVQLPEIDSEHVREIVRSHEGVWVVLAHDQNSRLRRDEQREQLVRAVGREARMVSEQKFTGIRVMYFKNNAVTGTMAKEAR